MIFQSADFECAFSSYRLPDEKIIPIFAAVMAKCLSYLPEFGISDSRFSCYARFPIGAYYICPPNNMDGKMQNCKV